MLPTAATGTCPPLASHDKLLLLLLLTAAASCCHTAHRSADDDEGCTGIVDAVFCREDEEGRLSHMAYHNSLTGVCGLFGTKLATSTAHTQCSNPSQPAARCHRPREPTALHAPELYRSSLLTSYTSRVCLPACVLLRTGLQLLGCGRSKDWTKSEATQILVLAQGEVITEVKTCPGSSR